MVVQISGILSNQLVDIKESIMFLCFATLVTVMGQEFLYQVPSDDKYYPRYDVEDNTELQEKAIEAWNRRV